MSTAALKKIPYLGAGIGLRGDISEETMSHANEIEILEIISEMYFSDKPASRFEFLEKFMKVFPVIPHGVSLSIGTARDLEQEHIHEVKKLCDRLKASFYSDHFAVTELPGIDIGHLSPIWYTKESLELVSRKITTLQDFLGLPVVLENITAPFTFTDQDFEEPEFITKVCHKTGCGLLLDITNVHINAHNQKHDAKRYMERYPLDHVVQVHVAGGTIGRDGWFSDTHSTEITGVNAGIWDLLEHLNKNADIKAFIIERDQDFKPDFEMMIMNDLRRARAILNRKSLTKLTHTSNY